MGSTNPALPWPIVGLRHSFGLLDKIAPQLAGAAALALFTQPLRRRRAQTDLMQRAERLKIPFREAFIQGYAWGAGPTVLLVHGWETNAETMTTFADLRYAYHNTNSWANCADAAAERSVDCADCADWEVAMIAPQHPVARFQQMFALLRPDQPMPLAEVYAPEIVFTDPLHHIEGIAALRSYFERLNANLVEGRFHFAEPLIGADNAWLPWEMTLQVRRIKQPVVVAGCSQLHFNTQVYRQRDYFDAGALIYENVPLLGAVIRGIKAQV